MTNGESRRRRSRLLVLSQDLQLLAALDEAVGSEFRLEMTSDPQEALIALAERPFAGFVIEAEQAGAFLNAACNGYLRCQPIGRVAIVSFADDPATLIRLAVRDPRVEVLFAPVQADTFHEALFGVTDGEDVDERTASRRTTRWLLNRT